MKKVGEYELNEEKKEEWRRSNVEGKCAETVYVPASIHPSIPILLSFPLVGLILW